MTETAYMAASTGLLWVAIYYLPIGDALFRLAIPLPLVLLQLRHGGRTALEGVAVTVLLLTVLMGPVRGPLMLFPYGLLSLWLGWCWRRQCSWWFSMAVGVLIGAAGFLVRVALVSLLRQPWPRRQPALRGRAVPTRPSWHPTILPCIPRGAAWHPPSSPPSATPPSRPGDQANSSSGRTSTASWRR